MFSRIPFHRVNWITSSFLIGTFVLSITTVPVYLWYFGFDWFQIILFFILLSLVRAAKQRLEVLDRRIRFFPLKLLREGVILLAYLLFHSLSLSYPLSQALLFLVQRSLFIPHGIAHFRCRLSQLSPWISAR